MQYVFKNFPADLLRKKKIYKIRKNILRKKKKILMKQKWREIYLNNSDLVLSMRQTQVKVGVNTSNLNTFVTNQKRNSGFGLFKI